VEWAVRVARMVGRPVATREDARRILKLKNQ
jgi:hypothetical protein